MSNFEWRSLEDDFAQLNLLALRFLQEDLRRDMKAAEDRFRVSHRTAQRLALLGPDELDLLCNVPQPLFKLDDSPVLLHQLSITQGGLDATSLRDAKLAHLAGLLPMADFDGRSLDDVLAQLNLLTLRLFQEDMRRDMQGALLRFGASPQIASRIAQLGPAELFVVCNGTDALYKIDDSPALNQLISEVQAGSDLRTLQETRLAHLASRRPIQK